MGIVISLAERRAQRPVLRVVERNDDLPSIVRAFAPWDGRRVLVKESLWTGEVIGWCPATRKLVVQHVDTGQPYWRQYDASELSIIPREPRPAA